MSTPTIIDQVSAKTTLMTTEANSLANNALVISSVGGSSGAFSNVSGGALGGYPYGRFKLTLATLGGAATANSGIDVWMLAADDATNYETGSSSVAPARPPDFTFPLIAQSAAQIVVIVAPIPIVGAFKVLIRNNASGQSLASSGNIVDVYPQTDTIPTI